MNLLLYSKTISTRLTYVCQQVFSDWLGLSVRYTNSIAAYQNHIGIKVNYSDNSLSSNDFFLAKNTLLFENNIKNRPLFPILYNKIPALFQIDRPDAVFPFDLLATIFFHLSRYEEYWAFKADRHGRFPASESWAYQNGCLQRPIVNLLVAELKKELKKRFPSIIFKKQVFQFQPTYDIDMAWAFRHKGWKRAIGGYVNDLTKGQFLSLKNRLKTHFGLQIDPFQKFDFLANLSRKFDLAPIYFFLLGDYGLYDKNNSVASTAFKNLIQELSLNNQIGTHPSYQSIGNLPIIKKEKQRLAAITNQEIHRSRQHYLTLYFPKTYQLLIENGITEDYSMGYAMDTGFRAGTALPFFWYDLEKETATNLRIHPFQVMEVTLKEYLHLTPAAAKERIQQLIANTKAVDGVFCSLWHNSSFSELDGWNDWEQVYVDMIEELAIN